MDGELADVMEKRRPTQAVAVSGREAEFVGDEIGEGTDPFGMTAGEAIMGVECTGQGQDLLGGGRWLVVDPLDDQFTGATNKQQTQNAISNDFALVGSFSLEDSFGETVLAQNPQVPDVSTTLAPSLSTLPNVFSANPTGLGWPNGPLNYFKRLYPTQALHTAVLTSTLPSALAIWNVEKPVMIDAGYRLAYSAQVPVTQTDFSQNVRSTKSKESLPVPKSATRRAVAARTTLSW